MVRKKILGDGKDQILKCYACRAEELKVSLGSGESVKSSKKKKDVINVHFRKITLAGVRMMR